MIRTRLRLAVRAAGLVLLVAGCQLAPRPSPTPLQTSLVLVAEVADCDSIGGCAAYVSIAPSGSASTGESRLEILELGVPHVVAGLPASIGPGRYVVRARLAAISDDRAVGQPAAETTVATCQAEIASRPGGALAAEVELSLVFHAATCEFHETLHEVDA